MCLTVYTPVCRRHSICSNLSTSFCVYLLNIRFIYSYSICETPKTNQQNDKSNACILLHSNTKLLHSNTETNTYTQPQNIKQFYFISQTISVVFYYDFNFCKIIGMRICMCVIRCFIRRDINRSNCIKL